MQPLHEVICSFLAVNMGTDSYFKSVPQTSFWDCKYLLAHQVCVHPRLKIVIKCTIYSCLSNVFLELQRPAVFSVGSNFGFRHRHGIGK